MVGYLNHAQYCTFISIYQTARTIARKNENIVGDINRQFNFSFFLQKIFFALHF